MSPESEKRGPVDKDELSRVVKEVSSIYKRYPNVVAVAAGIKFVGGNANKTDQPCIHFYVTEKSSPKKSLPKFVFSRFEDGRINYKKRLPTDVIEVGNIDFACGAGSEVSSLNESGSMTLIFRNKAVSDNENYYLITCSHVVGNLRESPPVDKELTSDCCQGIDPFAVVVGNTTVRGGLAEFDIAVAHLSDEAVEKIIAMGIPECSVVGQGIVLNIFMPGEEIRRNMELECQTKHDHYTGNVITDCCGSGWVGKYTINNLHTLQCAVKKGDSGGILYKDNSAVGIVVALSDKGYMWFHPLEEALNFLKNNNDPPLDIRVF